MGQRWRDDIFAVPTDTPTFGWHFSGTSPYLLIGDPDGDLDADTAATARLELGFATFGPLLIVMLRSADWPFLTMDSPRPFFPDDDIIKPTWNDDDHLLWTQLLVSHGVVANIRAFTTSPAVTVWLRHALQAQQAAGAVTVTEADRWIGRWQEATSTERDLWAMAQVTCHAGD